MAKIKCNSLPDWCKVDRSIASSVASLADVGKSANFSTPLEEKNVWFRTVPDGAEVKVNRMYPHPYYLALLGFQSEHHSQYLKKRIYNKRIQVRINWLGIYVESILHYMLG